MASYRLNATIVKGKDRGSVIRKAAYRAAERLENPRLDEVYDYSRKGGVAHTELMFQRGAGQVPTTRQGFWEAVEDFELGKRKDAQLAREVVVSLPHELTGEQRKALVRGFVQEAFVAQGMVADLAIHEPQRSKGDDPRNHHAHILLTLRKVGRSGFDPIKTRAWNSSEQLVAWRGLWAQRQNEALAQAGQYDRVDHRTLAAQRADALKAGQTLQAEALDRQPEIHVGPKARQASRRSWPVQSRPLKVSVYSRQRRYARERVVDYPRFDRGSRAVENYRRIEARAFKVQRLVHLFDARKARLAARQRHYLRQQKTFAEETARAMKRDLALLKDRAWLARIQQRKRMLETRSFLLETLIDRLAEQAAQIMQAQGKALDRQQRYQLSYYWEQRRQQRERDAREQAWKRKR